MMDNYPYFYSLYNLRNKYITLKYLNTLLKTYGINKEVNSEKLEMYQLAFIHNTYIFDKKSYFIENLNKNKNIGIEKKLEKKELIELHNTGYDSLEWLGDKILNTIIAEYIFKRYDKENSGYKSKIHSKLASNEILANLAKEIGFDKYLVISEQYENENGRNYIKDLGDIIESFICVLKLDIGMKKTTVFFHNLLEEHIDWVQLQTSHIDYKQKLENYFIKNGYEKPKYELISSNKLNKHYVIGILDQYKKIKGVGEGETKKIAEQVASKAALINYNQL
jgi:ribonuclease-3